MKTSWSREEQKKHRERWIKALRSGEYKQGIGHLRNDENEYCCLGVACEVALKNGVPIDISLSEDEYCYFYNQNGSTLPDIVKDYYGLRDDMGTYYTYKDAYKMTNLMELNDEDELSFNEIAAIIESEPEGLVE